MCKLTRNAWLLISPWHAVSVFAGRRYIKAKCIRAGDELRVLSDAGVQRVATGSYTPGPDAGSAFDVHMAGVWDAGVSGQPDDCWPDLTHLHSETAR